MKPAFQDLSENEESSGEDHTGKAVRKIKVGDKRKMQENGKEGVRHSRRNIAIVNYREADSCDFNEFCDDCKALYKSECPLHGPLIHIPDIQVPKGGEGRAMKTAPPQVAVARSKIPNANIGVWANTLIKRRSYFGPYEGRMVNGDFQKGDYAWEVGYRQRGKFWNFPVTPFGIADVNIFRNVSLHCPKRNVKKYGKVLRCVDSSDEKISNWMRYVNCARHVSELNLVAFVRGEDVYYRVMVDIPGGTELLTHYGRDYALTLGVNVLDFDKPLQFPLTNVIFKCETCKREFSNPIDQQRHHCVVRCFEHFEFASKPAITFPELPQTQRKMGYFTCFWCKSFFEPGSFFSHQNVCPHTRINDDWRKLHPYAYVPKLTKSCFV